MTRPLRKCEMQKILIADDDPTSLLVLIGLLRKMDYEVLVANDGVEAWNMFRLHSPSFVILDWVMPGATGVQICQRIRTSDLSYPVYIMLLTSKNSSEDVIEALNSGVDEIISKPIKSSELKARIEPGRRSLEYQQDLVDQNNKLQTALDRVKILEELLREAVLRLKN